MRYDELIDRVAWGVNAKTGVSVERARLLAEAAFAPVLDRVSESFAAREDNRILMKQNVSLTFTGGTATLPDKVLRKYLKDGTLIVVPSSGQKQIYSYEASYSAFQACKDPARTPDNRLGYWTAIGNTIEAVRPTNQAALASADVSSITLDTPCSPDVPATSTTQLDAPADMLPELIEVLIETVAGKAAEGE